MTCPSPKATLALAPCFRLETTNFKGCPCTPVGCADWTENVPPDGGGVGGVRSLKVVYARAPARTTMIATRITRSARDRPPFFVSTSGCASGTEDPDDSILPLLTVRVHATTNITVFWLTTRNVVAASRNLSEDEHGASAIGHVGVTDGYASSESRTGRVLIGARIIPKVRIPKVRRPAEAKS